MFEALLALSLIAPFQTGPNQLELKCPMLRVEVRTESPPDLPQRSGAIVLDLHEIEVEIRGSPPNPTTSKKARFPGPSGKALKEVAAMSWRWGLVAHTGPTGKHPKLPLWYIYSSKGREQSKGNPFHWSFSSRSRRGPIALDSSTISTIE